MEAWPSLCWITFGCSLAAMSMAAWLWRRSWKRQGSPTLAATAGTVYWPQDKPWLAEREAELLAFPNGRHDDQADCFACAALDATSTPSIDPVALGRALNAADAELFQPGPWPH
jgi:hypothetical protein